MYATSSALAALGGAYSDTSTIVTSVVSAVLIGGVALLGLGFGWRHLKKYITGRKF